MWGNPQGCSTTDFFSASAEIGRLAWRGRGGPWHPWGVTESPMRGVSIGSHGPWLGWWGYSPSWSFYFIFYLLGKAVYGDGSKHIKTILPKTARGWHGTSIASWWTQRAARQQTTGDWTKGIGDWSPNRLNQQGPASREKMGGSRRDMWLSG